MVYAGHGPPCSFISARSKPESRPPLRSIPTGTSLSRWRRTAARYNSSSSSCRFSSSFGSRMDSACSYTSVLPALSVFTTSIVPGASFRIPLKIVSGDGVYRKRRKRLSAIGSTSGSESFAARIGRISDPNVNWPSVDLVIDRV